MHSIESVWWEYHILLLIIVCTYGFDVFWNVPSQVCLLKYDISFNLSKYDIISNENEEFIGNKIVIFYETKPGLYPKFLKNGTAVNSGIPQNVSFAAHFSRAREDVKKFIPLNTFSGLSVIDWESWRPVFDRNEYEVSKHIYISESMKLVRQQHPSWNDHKVYTTAREEFQKAARKLMEGTIDLIKSLRPSGHHGYYGFPRCNNYKPGERFCTKETMHFNNQLLWLFQASSAFFPSIYINSSLFPDIPTRQERVQGILNETLRIQSIFPMKYIPAFAYTTYLYTDTKDFYKQTDIIDTMGQAMDAGLDGAVIWGSSMDLTSKLQCQQHQKYIIAEIGPVTKFIVSFAKRCRASLCNQHGKCVRANWVRDAPLYTMYHTKRFDYSQYKCRCDKTWTGRHCSKHVS